MLKTMLLALVVLCVPLNAQEAPIDHYEVGIFRSTVSMTTPYSTTIFPMALVTCGKLKTEEAPDATPNPLHFRWDDPADPTKDCVIDVKTLVLSLPLGTRYVSGVRACDAKNQCSEKCDYLGVCVPDWAFSRWTFRRAPIGDPCAGGTGTEAKVFIDLPSGPATVTLCVQR